MQRRERQRILIKRIIFVKEETRENETDGLRNTLLKINLR